MRRICLLFSLFFAAIGLGAEPKPEPLYPNGVPFQRGKDGLENNPTLTWYPAPKDRQTGVAVVVCPGGGYGSVCVSTEGTPIAKWVNRWGGSAVVLHYRLAQGGYHHPVPLLDAQRAIRTVRARAAEFGVDSHKIGIIGFSAGGHLAATAMTRFDAGRADAPDPVERVSCRPDFGILCYPVISFSEPFANQGTRGNLLGKEPPKELLESLSCERQVSPQTPPAFIYQTDADSVVAAENAVAFYLACRRHHVPAELHVFRFGAHGTLLGFARGGKNDWPALCVAWLKNMKFLQE